MFADKVIICIRSGKGGDGCVSFRREKYVPNGGPDGGDGGKGGNVIFEVDPGLNTLSGFRYKGKYCAVDGENGRKKNCHGANGENIIIKVPAGTLLKESESGKIITDMSGCNTRVVILKGGRGGLGNQNFATPTMQAPKYAQPGGASQELWIQMELKMIADVGLVGFPNVGKSTLLSRVTNAKPKIADYPFTTLTPNLGVVDLEGTTGFVLADIPGLLEGASEGVGLGHEFLRHIERTKVMIHVVDAASTEGRDPIEDIYTINRELEKYNADITKRPQIIAANKTDVIYQPEDDPIERIRREFEPQGYEVFPISAVTGKGLKELLYCVNGYVVQQGTQPVLFEQEYFPELQMDSLGEIVVKKEKEGVFVVDGAKIEKMLGYTNLDSEKGFAFFQRFLKESGILQQLEAEGIQEGDTVKLCDLQFDYY